MMGEMCKRSQCEAFLTSFCFFRVCIAFKKAFLVKKGKMIEYVLSLGNVSPLTLFLTTELVCGVLR